MRTIRAVVLIAGLGAVMLLMAWVLSREGTPDQPIRSPETAVSDPGPATPAVTPLPEEASQRGVAPAVSDDLAGSAAAASSSDSASVELCLVDASGAAVQGGEAWFEYSWQSDPTDAFPFPLDLESGSTTEIVKRDGSHAASGQDGLIRLTNIQVGRDLVLHVGGEHWKASPRRIAPLLAGERRQIGTISVFPAARILGRVLDPEGHPLARAHAELQARSGGATSSDAPQAQTVCGEDGGFDFGGLLPGAYVLRGSAPGFGMAVIDPLVLAEGGADLSVELRLPPGIPLHGRVLDEVLDPLPTARVELTEGDFSVANILESGIAVDDEGRFEIAVPAEPGRLRLVAAAPGYAAGSMEVLESGRPVEFILSPAVTVAGRVVDASGIPVPEALVRLQSFPEAPRLTSSAADGTFEFASVTAGDYRLEASAASGTAAIPSLLVHSGLGPLELSLTGGSGVLVTVIGSDAEPLQGVVVELFPERAWQEEVQWAAQSASVAPGIADPEAEEAPAPAEAVVETLDAPGMDGELASANASEAAFLVTLPRRGITDEHGTVLLYDVPSGTWEAQASLAGFLDGTLYFERNREFLEDLTLRLQRSSQLRVQVVGPAGEPVPHTSMALKREVQFSEDEEVGILLGARTDANGLAVWRKPEPGEYSLQVQVAASARQSERSAGTHFSEETMPVHLEAGATVEERFVLRSLCLPTVRVTRRGVPVPGAQVDVYAGELRPEEALALSFEPSRPSGITTDASGEADLGACVRGVHTLAARPPGGSPATLIQVDLQAGAQRIDLALAEGQIIGTVGGAKGAIAGAQITLLPALEAAVAGGADGVPDLESAERSARDGSDDPETSALADEDLGCMTGSDGAGLFLIDNVPPGRYRLRVQASRSTPWVSRPFAHDGREKLDLGTVP